MNGKSIRSAVVVMIGVVMISVTLAAFIISLVNSTPEALAFSPVKRHLAQRIRSYNGIAYANGGNFSFTTEQSEHGFILTDLIFSNAGGGSRALEIKIGDIPVLRIDDSHSESVSVEEINLESGIPIPSNTTVVINNQGGYDDYVIVSGYVF